MPSEPLEMTLEKWKKVLLAFCGAGVTLLVIALVDLPSNVADVQQSHYLPVMGWWAMWLLVLLGSLTPGIVLLVGRGWRRLPLRQRLNTAFGFLAVGWGSLLGFSLQTAGLNYGLLLHAAAWAAGIGLLMVYIFVRSKTQSGGEMFP